ncbi:Ldh family oxidoreductase [Acidovorax sp. LjRoot118]|uniref:Ldh family oxidoreductase n=1 Tax=unclassified Acidovorax TaxID=2684926 RepID=UPI003ECDE482
MPASPDAANTLDSGTLQAWSTRVLMGFGVAEEPAALTAGLLLRTSLRGIDTHGIARLPGYVDKLASGEVNARAVPRIDADATSWLRCDGDGGLGQVVASFALEQAMALARHQPLWWPATSGPQATWQRWRCMWRLRRSRGSSPFCASARRRSWPCRAPAAR